MLERPSEAYIQPSSPSHRVLQQNTYLPESPDMKIARNRLGNLLSGIRKGDIQAGQQDKRDQ